MVEERKIKTNPKNHSANLFKQSNDTTITSWKNFSVLRWIRFKANWTLLHDKKVLETDLRLKSFHLILLIFPPFSPIVCRYVWCAILWKYILILNFFLTPPKKCIKNSNLINLNLMYALKKKNCFISNNSKMCSSTKICAKNHLLKILMGNKLKNFLIE